MKASRFSWLGKSLAQRSRALTTPATVRRLPAAISVLAPLAFLLLFGQPAWAEEFHFNPASCAHNTGHMYIALGRTVLTVPTPKQADMLLDPLQRDEPHLKAPDPAEPVGCFGNPLQSGSFGLFWSNSLTSNAPGDRKLGVPARVRLLRTFVNLDGPHGEWIMEKTRRDIANDECRTAAVTELLPNGLVACRTKPTRPNVPEIDWAASYIARKEIYTTPDSHPFVINCGSYLFTSGVNYCEIEYTLAPDVGVDYEFRPYLGSYPISINNIITFDKSLRSIIKHSIVRHYMWSK